MSLSILTCVKSDTDDLFETYESVIPYLSPSFVWIVKYGEQCSDGFIDRIPVNPYITKHKSLDGDFYEGLNQALGLCFTEFYLVLGAGDKILEEGFSLASKFISQNMDADAYFFSVRMLAANSAIFSPNLDRLAIAMSCPHPGAIFKTKLSKEINGYSGRYEIASDYDHICRYVKNFKNVIAKDFAISEFKGGGMSDIRSNEGFIEQELIRMRVHQSHAFSVYGRLLAAVTTPITQLLQSNFK